MADAVRYLLDRPAVAMRMADTARARLGDRFGEPALRNALTAPYAPLPLDGAELRTSLSGCEPSVV